MLCSLKGKNLIHSSIFLTTNKQYFSKSPTLCMLLVNYDFKNKNNPIYVLRERCYTQSIIYILLTLYSSNSKIASNIIYFILFYFFFIYFFNIHIHRLMCSVVHVSTSNCFIISYFLTCGCCPSNAFFV